MSRKFLLILLAIFFTTLRFSFGQDPVFSQFYFNPVYLNPAYAGASKYIRLGLIYKNQWVGLNMPYSTYGASYDRTIQRFKNSGMGVNIVSDVEGNGTFVSTNVDLIYSYGFKPSYNSQLRFGLQTSALMRNRSYASLTFPDMINSVGVVEGSTGLTGSTTWNYDIAVGVAGDWNIFYGGVAVHHILEPVELQTSTQTAYIPRKYSVNIGAEFNLYKWYRFRDELLLSPNIIFIQQGNYNQLNIGAYISRLNFMAGFWLRENLSFDASSFIITAGYADEGFRVGYSYDFSILRYGLRGMPTSSHEVTLGWNFEYKRDKRKYRYMKCPKF